MKRLLTDAELERHVFGMVVFLVLLFAGLLLVNYLETCEHGRYGPAAPCSNPLDDYPHC